jgi:hypothetical protein
MNERRNMPVEKDKIAKLSLSKVLNRLNDNAEFANTYEIKIPVIFFFPEFCLSR